ncbi:hypothetical protein GQ600_6763 [Phytophthora cactorum]|nr:hypothetical protein GQ600_6763 [Phytophthora cactorum]
MAKLDEAFRNGLALLQSVQDRLKDTAESSPHDETHDVEATHEATHGAEATKQFLASAQVEQDGQSSDEEGPYHSTKSLTDLASLIAA